MAYNNSISTSNTQQAVENEVRGPGPSSAYEQPFLPVEDEGRGAGGPVNVTLPVNLLGNMQIPNTGYFIDHTMPQENIIRRYVPNALFDSTDIDDNGSVEIYELLPKAPTYPDTIPLNLEFTCN